MSSEDRILSKDTVENQWAKEEGFLQVDGNLGAGFSDQPNDCALQIRMVDAVPEDQEHRLVASGIGIPAGMKNPTAGDISVMMNSIVAAQASQRFLYRGWEVQTDGNPLAHAIMRGYVDNFGHSRANYHYEDLRGLFEAYGERDYKNPACIVDCNHANSGKKWIEQIRIAKDEE